MYSTVTQTDTLNARQVLNSKWNNPILLAKKKNVPARNLDWEGKNQERKYKTEMKLLSKVRRNKLFLPTPQGKDALFHYFILWFGLHCILQCLTVILIFLLTFKLNASFSFVGVTIQCLALCMKKVLENAFLDCQAVTAFWGSTGRSRVFPTTKIFLDHKLKKLLCTKASG